MIDDPEIWFIFSKERNKIAHEYGDEIQNTVMLIFDDFLRELNKLIDIFNLINKTI